MSNYKQKQTLELIKEYREDNKSKVEALLLNMFETDLRYHRADTQWLKECERVRKAGGANVPENVQPPILLEQTETMTAYLTSIFLARSPIYSPSLPPKMETEETAIESLMLRYQDDNMWVAEELQALRNVVKHNLGATLIKWESVSPIANEGRTFSKDNEGLVNKTLSLYDCLWDTETQPKDFNSEGMYFEWNQHMTKHKARKYLSKLKTSDTIVTDAKIEKLLEGKEEYQVIDVMRSLKGGIKSTTGGDTDYSNFFDDDGKLRGELAPTFSYEGFRVSTVYLRARDKDLGYTGSTSKRYSILKVTLLNDVPIAVQKLDLPMFEVILSVGIVDDFGYDTKSIVEPVKVYQDIASKLIKAKLSATRRSMHDRAVYNPLYLKSTDVNNSADALKMPVRRNRWFDPDAVNKAYKALPFQDNTSRELLSDAGLFMNDLPNRATGVSEFRRSPVRGNKSKGQFELESQAADGRGYTLALTLEASRYTSIRKLMKIQLITNTPAYEGLDWEKVTSSLEFKISDGLTSLGLFDSLDNLDSFMNLASQNPTFAPLVGQILSYVLSARTPFKLQDFIPTQPPQGDANADTRTDGRPKGEGTNTA